MVGIREVSFGFSALSGLFGLVLLAMAVRTYRQERSPVFAFMAGAFSLFTFKSFLVAYAVWTDLIGHELLEFIDAVGDLGTIFLLTVPFLWPQR